MSERVAKIEVCGKPVGMPLDSARSAVVLEWLASDGVAEMFRDNAPCADALDCLWRDVILARNPDYGDWEYPGQAYRHLLAEYNDLRKRSLTREELEALQSFVPDECLNDSDEREYDRTLLAQEAINKLQDWIA